MDLKKALKKQQAIISGLRIKQSKMIAGINNDTLLFEKLTKDLKTAKDAKEKADDELSEILSSIKRNKEKDGVISAQLTDKEEEVKKLNDKINKTISTAEEQAKKIIDDANSRKKAILMEVDSVSNGRNKIKSELDILNKDIENAEIEKGELLKSNKTIADGNSVLENTKINLKNEIEIHGDTIKAKSEIIVKNEEIIKNLNISIDGLRAKEKLITGKIDSKNIELAKKIEEYEVEAGKTAKIVEENKELEKYKFIIAEQKKQIKESIRDMQDVYKRAGIKELPEILL